MAQQKKVGDSKRRKRREGRREVEVAGANQISFGEKGANTSQAINENRLEK